MSATALAATALLMGLAGAPHCTAMCASACAALSGGSRRATDRTEVVVQLHPSGAALSARGGAASSAGSRLAALLAGRLVSYAALGALVAASVPALAQVGASAAPLRPLWAMLHVGAIALGLALLVTGRQPAWMQELSRRLGRWAARDPGASVALPRLAGAGLLWGAMPCGLLQSALVVAALGSSAVEGALVMAAFALGSSLGLVLGPMLWHRLASAGRLGSAEAVTRLAGGLLALTSGWALWHLAVAAFDPLVCRA